MTQYTEEEIDRIIGDCENLIIPDETISIDGSERLPKLATIKKSKSPKSVILTRYLNEEDNSEDYFETFFHECKQKKHIKQTPEIQDYSSFLSNNDESSSKPSPENAIFVNKALRKRLVQLRKSIEESITKINKRLETLGIFLEDAKSNDVKDAMSFKTTYIKCGRPYFKDALSYPAPENDDFKYRKNVLKEMFPFDLPPANIKWKTKEKVQLVRGIKNQMIDFIKLQQSKKVCQESKTKTRGKLQKLRFISSNQDLNDMSISNLYETIQNYPEFHINWNLISFNDLQSAHTVSECMGMWYSYLKPDINREPFTDEENAILSHLVIEQNYQNWDFIAQKLDKRTSLQTFSYFKSECARLCPPNVRWTPEEDEMLLEAIRKATVVNVISWNKVGFSIPSRNKTQCYNRYLILNQNSNVKKGVFSPQENRILLNYVAKYGPDFNKMPQDLLPNRSIVQIKNHYNVALKHKGQVHPWTLEEDKKLMEFVEKEGTNNWKKISDILTTHNRLSCRTRYLTISKFLKKNPNKSIKDVPSRLKTITAVHKATNSESENENGNEEEVDDKVAPRAKAFGVLNFNEFKIKNMHLYNLMKTSFRYKLVHQQLDVDFSRFLILKSLLNIDHYGLQRKYAQAFTPNQYNKINEILSTNLSQEVERDILQIKRKHDFLVPLNYYTSVGLRSIAIKMHEDAVDTNERPVLNPSTQIYDNALKNFQKLFFSLFYWPAMMSKLEPTELVNFKGTGNTTNINRFLSAASASLEVIEIPVKRSSVQKFYEPVVKKQKKE